MVNRSARFVVAGVGVALALTAGAGVASADPGVEAAINSSCTYPQAVAALNAQAPEAAQQFAAVPQAQAWLQTFIASPVDQRRQMAQQVQSFPAAAQYMDLVVQVASTCNNY